MQSDFAERAAEILHNLALERERRTWSQRLFWQRWVIPSEPLRNDAANLLRAYEVDIHKPKGTRYVGDDE